MSYDKPFFALRTIILIMQFNINEFLEYTVWNAYRIGECITKLIWSEFKGHHTFCQVQFVVQWFSPFFLHMRTVRLLHLFMTFGYCLWIESPETKLKKTKSASFNQFQRTEWERSERMEKNQFRLSPFYLSAIKPSHFLNKWWLFCPFLSIR